MGGISLNSFRAMAGGNLNLGSVILKTDEKTGEMTLEKVNNTLNGRKIGISNQANARVRTMFVDVMAADLAQSLGSEMDGVKEFIEQLKKDLLGENSWKDLRRKGDISTTLDKFDAFKTKKLIERDVRIKSTDAEARFEREKALSDQDYSQKAQVSRLKLDGLRKKYVAEVGEKVAAAWKNLDAVKAGIQGKINAVIQKATQEINNLKVRFTADVVKAGTDAKNELKTLKDGLLGEVNQKVGDLREKIAALEEMSDELSEKLEGGAGAEADVETQWKALHDEYERSKESLSKAEARQKALESLFGERPDDAVVQEGNLEDEVIVKVNAAKRKLAEATAAYEARVKEFGEIPEQLPDASAAEAGPESPLRGEIINAKAELKKTEDLRKSLPKSLDDFVAGFDVSEETKQFLGADAKQLNDAMKELAQAQAEADALKDSIQEQKDAFRTKHPNQLAFSEVERETKANIDAELAQVEKISASANFEKAKAGVNLWRGVLEREVVVLKEEIVRKEAELAAMKGDGAEKKDEASAKEQELADLKADVEVLEKKIAGTAVGERPEDFEGASDLLEDAENKSNELKKFLEERLAAKESEVAKREEQGIAGAAVDNLKDKIAWLKHEIVAAETAITAAEDAQKAVKDAAQDACEDWKDAMRLELGTAATEYDILETKKSEWEIVKAGILNGDLGATLEGKREDWEDRSYERLLSAQVAKNAADADKAEGREYYDPASERTANIANAYGDIFRQLGLEDADHPAFNAKVCRRLCKESGAKVSEKSFQRIFTERGDAVKSTALRLIYLAGGQLDARTAVVKAVEELRAGEREARDTSPKPLSKSDRKLIDFLKSGVQVPAGMTERDALVAFMTQNRDLANGFRTELLGALKLLAINGGTEKSVTFEMPVSADGTKKANVVLMQRADNSIRISYKNHVFDLPKERTARAIVLSILPAIQLPKFTAAPYDNYNGEPDEETRRLHQEYDGPVSLLEVDEPYQVWFERRKAELEEEIRNAPTAEAKARAENKLRLHTLPANVKPFDVRLDQDMFVKRIDKMISTLRECNNRQLGVFGGSPHFRDTVPLLNREDAKPVKLFGIFDTGRTKTFFRSFWNKAARTGDFEFGATKIHFGTFLMGAASKAASFFCGVPLQVGEADGTDTTLFEKTALYLHQLRQLAQNANWLLSRFDRNAPGYTAEQRALSKSDFVKLACSEVNRITQFRLHESYGSEQYSPAQLANGLMAFLEMHAKGFDYAVENNQLVEFYQTISSGACMQDCLTLIGNFCTSRRGMEDAWEIRDYQRPEDKRLKPLPREQEAAAPQAEAVAGEGGAEQAPSAPDENVSPEMAERIRLFEEDKKAGKLVIHPRLLDELMVKHGESNDKARMIGQSPELVEYVRHEIDALHKSFNPSGTRPTKIFTWNEVKPFLKERFTVLNEKFKEGAVENEIARRKKSKKALDLEKNRKTAQNQLDWSKMQEKSGRDWFDKFAGLDLDGRVKMYNELKASKKGLSGWVNRYVDLKGATFKENLFASDVKNTQAQLDSIRAQQDKLFGDTARSELIESTSFELMYDFDMELSKPITVKVDDEKFLDIIEENLRGARIIKNDDKKQFVTGTSYPSLGNGTLISTVGSSAGRAEAAVWNPVVHGYDFMEVRDDADGKIKWRTPDGKFEIANPANVVKLDKSHSAIDVDDVEIKKDCIDISKLDEKL